MIEKSGVGRAIYHQKTAAGRNHISCVDTMEEADVVHINTIFPKSLWTAYRAKKRNIPVVYHAHTTSEDFRNSFIGTNQVAGLFRQWLKCCYRCSDVVVTPSEYSKSLLENYQLGRRIEVISNGIDLEYYNDNQKTEQRKLFREKYGYQENDKIIMSAGLQIARKGILDFVEMAKAIPQYQFIWFGESNPMTIPHAIRKAIKTKLPNLRFAGYVGRDDLKQAYQGCDLFLFPSKEETEGIVILEALAMKIPVLVRNIPVYDGWLQDNRQVYMADSIQEFMSRATAILEEELPDLTKQAYEVARARSIDKVGERLYETYQSIQDSPLNGKLVSVI